MTGILAYGTYLPYWRIQRSSIGSALGTATSPGTRTVASYDEDTTSMGVEAARIALRQVSDDAQLTQVLFSTTMPSYADKTNAAIVHAALGLPADAGAYDVLGAVRSGTAASQLAEQAGGLAVMADIRSGLPGSSDESNGGDAAVAFVYGDGPDALTETLATAAVSREFLDRWRVPGEHASRRWEERFGEHLYVPMADAAISAGLDKAGLKPTDLDHVIIVGDHTRACAAVARSLDLQPGAVADDLRSVIGAVGTAHAGLVLADVLDRASAGEAIAVVQLADGCDVTVLRTTQALSRYKERGSPTLRSQLLDTRDDLAYARFITWRGFLDREAPRRPEPDQPASPPSSRSEKWKYAFIASRDEDGFVQLPPSRVSMNTRSLDRMTEIKMADRQATIATFTVDQLAYSLSPPVVTAVIDFDGGGRFQCEVTDVDLDAITVGSRVRMTFRRLGTHQSGVHNYFWKAAPVAVDR